jgi:hypothetical protein
MKPSDKLNANRDAVGAMLPRIARQGLVRRSSTVRDLVVTAANKFNQAKAMSKRVR